MSLKAKIEAVIYASEEPVTLAQLVGLLGVEAQAELDRNAREQLALTVPESENENNADASTTAIENAGVEPARGTEESDTAVAVPEEPAADMFVESAEKSKADREAARRLREHFRSILDELVADYATGDRGLEIREVASGYRLATKPEYHDAVRGFIKSLKPPLKLSLQALETLAVIAYKQPITVPEISEIRGVDSGGVLGSLMTRKLVTTAGRKQVIGRPILYKTTKDFLLRFGLKDISELPSMEEFEKMAGELTEQEEMPLEHSHDAAPAVADAPETADELDSQRHTHSAQADGSPDPVDDPLDDQIADDGQSDDTVEAEPQTEAPEATDEIDG